MYRTLIFALSLLLATAAAGERLPRWRTPEGRLYFGDSPPPGSKRVERIEPAIHGDSAPQPTTAPRRLPRTAAPPGRTCEDRVFIRFTRTVQVGDAYQRFSGLVENIGKESVQNVQVCGGSVCVPVREGGPISPGEIAPFSLDTAPGGEFRLRTLCSNK